MADSPYSVWETVLLVFLGWLLGLLAPIIVDAIKTKYRNSEIRIAILAELNEARYRLGGTVYLIESRFGTFDRKLLEWIVPILENYKGPNPTALLAESIRKQLSLDDAQLAALARQAKAEPGGALAVKKCHVPYIDSRLAELGAFDEAAQALILDIRAKIDQINEEVDQERYYFQLTYQPGITEENHRLASESVANCYRNIGQMARLIIERINQLTSV